MSDGGKELTREQVEKWPIRFENAVVARWSYRGERTQIFSQQAKYDGEVHKLIREFNDHDAALRQRAEAAERELEAQAWKISPAMAQAKIDQQNVRLTELEARVRELEFDIAASAISTQAGRSDTTPLTWTTEPPTVAGQFLFRDVQGLRFVVTELHESVVMGTESLWCNYMRFSNGMTGGLLIEHLEGEWCPIPLPQEAV